MTSPSTSPDAHSRATAKATNYRHSSTRHMCEVPEPATDSENDLLAFDPDADLESIIPMPPTIPARVREAITRALGARYEFGDELDEWLHAPHPSLEGDTPFERIVASDGISVLRLLVVHEPTDVEQAPGSSAFAPSDQRPAR